MRESKHAAQMPQIHKWRQEGLSFGEIAKRLGEKYKQNVHRPYQFWLSQGNGGIVTIGKKRYVQIGVGKSRSKMTIGDVPKPVQQGGQLWLVIGCVHRPFHNQVLWKKLLQLAQWLGPKLYGVVIAGDYLDMASLSFHDKGKLPVVEGLDLSFEYADGLRGIRELTDATSAATIRHFIYGNHEDRFFRGRRDVDTRKLSLPEPADALYLDELGYQVHRNWQEDYVTLGSHLDVMHGLYTCEHAAKKHLANIGGSALFFHTHRFQVHIEGDRAAYNCGWLGDINAQAFRYQGRMQRRRWREGFALAHIDDRGDYFVNPISCYNNKFFALGRMF